MAFPQYFSHEEKNLRTFCVIFLDFPILCLSPSKVSPFFFQLCEHQRKNEICLFFSHRDYGLEEYHVGCFMSQQYPSDYKGAQEKEFSCIHVNHLSLST